MSSHDRTGLPAVGSRRTEAPATRPIATVSRPRPAKITDRQSNKLAIVYVRQSSTQQIFEHKDAPISNHRRPPPRREKVNSHPKSQQLWVTFPIELRERILRERRTDVPMKVKSRRA